MAPMKVSLGGWIGATTLGWILGVPLVAGLAIIGEALGIGGVQVLVGAGMGLGVGLLQGRLIRRLGVSARALGHDPRFALYVCVILGGAIAGLGGPLLGSVTGLALRPLQETACDSR
jgi:hypothetical protein